MILDSIRLENFGAYGGLQESTLTPAADKTVILFGGMNGGGKTTLLDALQLVLYGPKAKVSNRGRMAYRDYLAECIHRGGDPGEGAGITLRFRRMIEGETRHFEVERSWRQGVKGIEETVRVLRDGQPDETLTAQWDEEIEAYLPVAISNLFFFDGEQIKELAEGDQTAAILGTAMEILMLESFRALLRKNDLVHGLRIDPESFEITLSDRAGRTLPFDRLSAGERQLLATAMLWGLARASGRPIPTIIDTPLGRLDSSHSKHLVERYFPFASHQVLLLSTDEEIVGSYHQSLKPAVSRHDYLAA